MMAAGGKKRRRRKEGKGAGTAAAPTASNAKSPADADATIAGGGGGVGQLGDVLEGDRGVEALFTDDWSDMPANTGMVKTSVSVPCVQQGRTTAVVALDGSREGGDTSSCRKGLMRAADRPLLKQSPVPGQASLSVLVNCCVVGRVSWFVSLSFPIMIRATGV